VTRPLIGITGALEPARRGGVAREAVLSPVAYSRAVEQAGGIPVVLPPVPPRCVPPLVAGLDGLLITCSAGPRPDRRRDTFELALAGAAIGAGRPFLAVCRGLHALNAARAGTLLPPDAMGDDPDRPGPATTPAHHVQVSAHSRLGQILGIRVSVPAGHPHRLQQLGAGLLAVAWPGDQVILETAGTVEAVEVTGHRFGIGVQWHPEEDQDPRLIAALVTAASAR
jgi:putative glutamine amidotransferase